MKTKYSRALIMAGALSISTMLIAPSYAEDTATAVITTSVAPTATIHVLTRVINDNLGTAMPTDFTLTLKHHGQNVVGSPFIGAGGAGVTFVVAPGTYVAGSEQYVGYTGQWFNGEIVNGFIDILAGQEVTIVRVFQDNGYAETVVSPPATEDGGLLPNTATPVYNYLLAGSLFAAAGAFGIRRSISLGSTK